MTILFKHLKSSIPKSIFLIGLFIISINNNLFSQKKSSLYEQQANQLSKKTHDMFESSEITPETIKLAKKNYLNALSLYQQAKVKDLNVADIFFQLGMLSQEQEDYENAFSYYKNALSMQRKLTSSLDSGCFKTYICIGDLFFVNDLYDSSKYYYNQAEKIAIQYPNIEHTFRLYNSIGNIYFDLGNYQQSINYYEQSFRILSNKDTKASHYQNIVTIGSNIASAFRKLGKYNEAIVRYKELLTLGASQDFIYQKIGKAYFEAGRYDSALVYLNTAKPETGSYDQIKLYNNLGLIHTKLGHYTQALSYYNQVIPLCQAKFGNKNIDIAKAYLGKGQIYEAQGQLKRAVSFYHIALQSLHFTFASTHLYQNPGNFDEAVSRLSLFEALKYKARGLQHYYQQTKQLSQLKASLQTYQIALQLADQIRKSYDSDEAKLFFSNTVFPVYEEAMATAFTLHAQTKDEQYVHIAFAFSEQSKAAVLAETLRGVEIRQTAGLDPKLLQQEKDLKRKITRLNVEMLESGDSSTTVTNKEKIRDYEIELAGVVKKMEANSAYHQLKYNTTLASIPSLQKDLKDNVAMVEYFLGKDHLYSFIITNNHFQTFQVPIDSSFSYAIGALKKELQAYETGTYGGQSWSKQLYQKVIGPIQHTLAGKDRIVFIPDGELHYIPLEILSNKPEQGQYLLHDFTCSYAYSATLLQRNLQDKKRKTGDALLAMAPFAGKFGANFRGSNILPLPASKEEVEQIGGRIYLEAAATKDQFLKVARSYGIIHLATHAKADDNDPLNSYITFYPKNADSLAGYRLYTPELYNLQLDSVKLVVLSACETGGGKLQRGEGVMSLARAFAYAGCPNIVMTLWNANDKATASITSQMHTYLKEGYCIDEALRQAKLDYLESDLPTHHKLPYYWSGFVFIGDHAAIYKKPFPYSWAIAVVVFMAALVMLWRWRSRQSIL
jgi:CHAT domain-containing protein/Tfp pilus assembly protein PilF